MPDPRQQDHKLSKGELVTYRYSVVLVEQLNIFTNFCNNRIDVVFPREILINKSAQVLYANFRIETNILFIFIIKHACKVLVGKRVAFGKDEKLQNWIF